MAQTGNLSAKRYRMKIASRNRIRICVEGLRHGM